jgi:hypothetical protein
MTASLSFAAGQFGIAAPRLSRVQGENNASRMRAPRAGEPDVQPLILYRELGGVDTTSEHE